MKLEEWITHDEYWQEAIYQSVNAVIEARNKASQEQTDKILKSVQESKESAPYVSPFASSGIRPQFQMS